MLSSLEEQYSIKMNIIGLKTTMNILLDKNYERLTYIYVILFWITVSML